MANGPSRGEAIRVGVLGCGNVGGALVELLVGDAGEIESRTGLRLELGAVAVRSTARERPVAVPRERLTHDAAAVVGADDVDVVVELIGGIEPARSLILEALKAGKPVVTANKELLANCGAELFEAAASAGVDLLFEASVAGGIPLIRPLRESLAGERIRRVMGIVNGTTNYILSRMAEAGASYHDALGEAQSLGYAERDPTADVEGFDAAAKAAILANIAFGARVVAGDVYREGISGITADDIAVAGRLGYAIKLLAVAERVPVTEQSAQSVSDRRSGGRRAGDPALTMTAPEDQPDAAVPAPAGSEPGAVAVRVHPALVPLTHPLASVRDSFNAVFIEGEAVGELMLLGRGAGGRPTASAVLGDLLDAAHNLQAGMAGRTVTLRRLPIRPIDDLRSEYYVTMDVADRPGVLASVAGVLGRHNVSIRSMEQPPVSDQQTTVAGARLIFMTHTASERDVQQCLHELRQLDAVEQVNGVLRVVGGR